MQEERFKKIKTFIFDMDGVLTNSTVLLLENGLQARQMNIKDGYGLQLAVKKGYRVIVISGGDSLQATDRLNKLGITEVYMKNADKQTFIEKYMAEHGLTAGEILFMGDDIPDLAAMELVGLAAAPSDAVFEILEAADYISPLAGGQGCVRDVIEKVMKLNDDWHHEMSVRSR